VVADLGGNLIGIATLITAITTAWATLRVHKEVKTSNGKTIAKLVDLQEGRRIERDVPAEDRTRDQRAHVEEVKQADERNGKPRE
jgi:hypothetical protein